jgi:hypothetical protein
MHALHPETAAMLGGVNGIRVPCPGYGVPRPPWCSRAPQVKTDQREDCLSPATQGEFHSAGFYRGAQGSQSEAQTKPWGAFSFAFFSLGMQRKEGRVCAAAHI